VGEILLSAAPVGFEAKLSWIVAKIFLYYMKAITFISAFFILGLPWAIWLDFNTFADEPKAPTSAERQNFQSQLDKLQSHVALFPKNLGEAIKSLTDSVTFAFDCPETAKVRQISIRITTRQIKWDTALIVNNEKIVFPPKAAAYYLWQHSDNSMYYGHSHRFN